MAQNHTTQAHGEIHGKPFRRLLRMLAPDKKDIGYIYLYAIVAGIINLSLPLGIQAVINLITGGVMPTSWMVLVVIVTIGVALVGVFQIMQISITEVLQQRIFTRAAFDFAYRIPRLRVKALADEYAPELANRFFDILNVQKGLPKMLIDISAAILQIIFGLLLLSFYHPFFVIFGLTLVLLLVLLLRITSRKGLETSLAESKYKYKVAHWLQELGRNLETFKLEGLSPYPLDKTDALVGGYLKARKQHFKVLVTQYSNIIAFKTIITAFLLILGSILVVEQQINIGQFVASEIVIISITSSVEKLILSMETIYDVLTAMEKVGHVTDLPLEEDHGIAFSEIDTQKGVSVALENFSLTLADGYVALQGINIEVKAGERVCIAGENGSGKTTLLRVLAGLYEDFEGRLLYNDVPFHNINLTELRANIGEAIAEAHIFGGTIAENISMGRKDIPFQVVKDAAEQVGLLSYIKQLPRGFDTVLLPEGKNLAGTVIRRIILARAISQAPALLLVDDIFSAFPTEERSALARVLTDSSHPWTVIAVSKDPAVQQLFNRVVALS